jgi:hypothetical protein
VTTDSLNASSLDNFTADTHVKVIDKQHPWNGATGKLVRFQKYGPGNMFSGWLVNLDNGQSIFANRKQMRII